MGGRSASRKTSKLISHHLQLLNRNPKHRLGAQRDAAELKVTSVKEANAFVRRKYRKGWEVKGL